MKCCDRLEACRLTIHGLLHVADNIRDAGPVWATWSFVMERFAGSLLPAVKSRRRPNAALANRAERVARLELLKNLYDLHDRLNFNDRLLNSDVSTREITYDECTLIWTSGL